MSETSDNSEKVYTFSDDEDAAVTENCPKLYYSDDSQELSPVLSAEEAIGAEKDSDTAEEGWTRITSSKMKDRVISESDSEVESDPRFDKFSSEKSHSLDICSDADYCPTDDRLAVVQCLKSASEQELEIESFVDDLEDNEVLSEDSSQISVETGVDTSVETGTTPAKISPKEEALRHFAAFPALDYKLTTGSIASNPSVADTHTEVNGESEPCLDPLVKSRSVDGIHVNGKAVDFADHELMQICDTVHIPDNVLKAIEELCDNNIPESFLQPLTTRFRSISNDELFIPKKETGDDDKTWGGRLFPRHSAKAYSAADPRQKMTTSSTTVVSEPNPDVPSTPPIRPDLPSVKDGEQAVGLSAGQPGMERGSEADEECDNIPDQALENSMNAIEDQSMPSEPSLESGSDWTTEEELTELFQVMELTEEMNGSPGQPQEESDTESDSAESEHKDNGPDDADPNLDVSRM